MALEPQGPGTPNPRLPLLVLRRMRRRGASHHEHRATGEGGVGADHVRLVPSGAHGVDRDSGQRDPALIVPQPDVGALHELRSRLLGCDLVDRRVHATAEVHRVPPLAVSSMWYCALTSGQLPVGWVIGWPTFSSEPTRALHQASH